MLSDFDLKRFLLCYGIVSVVVQWDDNIDHMDSYGSGHVMAEHSENLLFMLLSLESHPMGSVYYKFIYKLPAN